MGKNDIYVVIVIYNKHCQASSTCQCLAEIAGINVIIVDNSTQDNDNESFALAHEWTYISMNGNEGLAKAYNRAVEAIAQPDALVCLFDDDSHIDDNYFTNMANAAVADESATVFLPQVYDKHGLMSPSIVNGFKVRRTSDTTEVTQANITGINSGMAVRRRVFDEYRYDERYFLDYIDHSFIRDMKKRSQRIVVTEARLTHSVFFENTEENFEAIAKRMQIFKKDYKIFCGSSLRGRLAYVSGIFRHKLYFFLKFGKKIRYFFI